MDPSAMKYPPLPENSLIHEKSPYLLLHAHQPVHWQPWSDGAFEDARRLDRPVFLSIGYSTCHWCHVMARESFDDGEVARLLNEGFISIKVDREERPDIDQIYMAACLKMTGSGGWPLTIILTPDKKPFFAATYLPKQTRFGMIGLLDLLPKVRDRWGTHRPALQSIGEEVTSLLQHASQGKGVQLNDDILGTAFRDLVRHFDPLHGGFSPPPKFPTTQHLFFLLRYWWRTGESEALRMVETTLHGMRMGGIYDHIGFGFHRYAVDAEWRTPHFEKMLYDQAFNALAFLELFHATRNAWYADTVREIFTYVLRDLSSTEGGFYAAEDAESEGMEGQFYRWTRNELTDALTPAQRTAFFQVFRDPQTEGGSLVPAPSTDRASTLSMHSLPHDGSGAGTRSDTDTASLVTSALRSLSIVRQKRPRPQKDTKILTDWNGLFIAALARGGRILSDHEYITGAEKAMEVILQQVRSDGGRLYHELIGGTARIDGFLDDYAAVVWGLIELYEATFKERYLVEALSLVDIASTYFKDTHQGGYYFTASDGESLLLRQKETQDGAYPSGNAIMMRNLLRLARLTGRADLEEEAHTLWNGCSDGVESAPRGFTGLLTAAGEALESVTLVIVGDPAADDTRVLVDTLNTSATPPIDVLFVPCGEQRSVIERVARFVRTFQMVGGHATAYLCTGYACHRPTTAVSELLAWIHEARAVVSKP